MASTDDAVTNRKFAEANHANFPVLADPSKQTAQAYGVLSPLGYASRWTFYIDGTGKIAAIDADVSPLTAGADVLKHLKALAVPVRE
jgi:thioredoxin-dependent peroxiredoxin